MPIHFDAERMETVRKNHELWWRGELDRPLVSVIIADAYPRDHEPAAPVLSQENCADLSWSPEAVIDALEADMSQTEFLADSFPFVNLSSFGPGSLAAMCGAKLDNRTGNVWFFPPEEKEIQDIQIRYDPENVWVKRIKDIYRAGLEKWEGNVIMGMPDLGGILDVVSTFCHNENLLVALLEEPDELKRLIREAHTAWYQAYNDFSEVLAPQKAWTDWSGVLSNTPSYILQCDFCYMISNPMFREFVLDTLREDTERLDHTIYHLDGIGQLRHMDDVLSLPGLNAFQWAYGAGQPGPMHWLDVYRKVQRSGKQLMLTGGAFDFLEVIEHLHGSPYMPFWFSKDKRELAERVIQAR